MQNNSKIWSTKESIWFQELKVISPYREFQYDKIIQSHIKTLFPDYFCVPYSKTIKAASTKKGSKPDFAIIKTDYSEWWIVEVERIEDDLKHVSQQIENFTNGTYNFYKEAKYIYEKDESLNFDELKKMTRSNPKVLVIVDSIHSEWILELGKFDPDFMVLKVYGNNGGFELISVSGDYPYVFEEITYCNFTNAMKNLLKVNDPEILIPQKKNKKGRLRRLVSVIKNPLYSLFSIKKDILGDTSKDFHINYKGQKTIWRKVDSGNQTYLQPLGPHGLQVNKTYVLKRFWKNNYLIESIA
jgi:hypothetical protein